MSVDGDYSLESSTLYAPGDGGRLTITADSTDYGFHESTVCADKETDKIKIECYDRDQINDGSGNYAPRAVCECCGNTIHATDSYILNGNVNLQLIVLETKYIVMPIFLGIQ